MNLTHSSLSHALFEHRWHWFGSLAWVPQMVQAPVGFIMRSLPFCDADPQRRLHLGCVYLVKVTVLLG